MSIKKSLEITPLVSIPRHMTLVEREIETCWWWTIGGNRMVGPWP